MTISRIVDGLTNLVSSTGEVKDAIKHKDGAGLALGIVQVGKGSGDGMNYASLAASKGLAFAALFFDVNEKVAAVIDKISTGQCAAGLGIVLGSLTVIIQSISIHRINQLLAVIPTKAELASKLGETVVALKNINQNHLKKNLPPHLQDIDLDESFKTGSAQNAENTINQIRDYAFKKRVVHILTLIGGIIGIVAGIGLLVGFPPLALTLLGVAGIALTITCIVLNKGWVNNQEQGFDWTLCLPEALRKKLTNEYKDPKEFELEFIRDGVQQVPHFVDPTENNRIPTVQTVLAESVGEKLQKISLWDRFILILRKKEEPGLEMTNTIPNK